MDLLSRKLSVCFVEFSWAEIGGGGGKENEFKDSYFNFKEIE